MSITFYISGHGFGHASREVEIINRLGATLDTAILVRSAVNPALLKRTITVPYKLLPGPADAGVIQTSSVAHDDEATVAAALEFYQSFDERVEQERRLLEGRGVSIIVSDIPPLAFDVATRLGVPSVAISNFTWDWIFETHPGFLPKGKDVLARMRASYRQATLALELPFSGGFEVFDRVERLPLVARRATRSRAETRAFFGLPAQGRIALLSFGGYGLPSLDLGRLDAAPDWTIVTTDSVSATAPLLPSIRAVQESAFTSGPFRYEDLIAAVDVVITKPGYGVISECISTGTRMLYTSRGAFREAAVLVAALPRFVASRFIRQDDLFAGRWRAALEAVMAQPDPPERMPTNGADVAAARIREVERSGTA